MPQQIVGCREVEIQLADEGRIERHGLQFDDDVAAKLEVVEEQVDVEVLVADLEQHLPAHEREAGAQLQEEALNVIDQRLLDLAFAARIGGPEEVEEIRILEYLGGSVAAKFVSALPWRSWTRPWIRSTRMLCDQPCSMAWRAYQRRSAESSSFSNSAMWWYQGIRARGSCTIARSGHAAAKALMYLRLRGEKPFMSGKASRRSEASRSITFAPQPARSCRSRIIRPMSQYSRTIAEFAERTWRNL